MSDTVTVIEASNQFGFNPDYIKQLIRRGKLPGAKLVLTDRGRAGYRIPVAALQKYFEGRKKSSEEKAKARRIDRLSPYKHKVPPIE